MGTRSKFLKYGAQGIFYLVILALIVSRSVTASISHYENQFIAPGQLLASRGLLPYLDSYLHMPYPIPMYALTASVSELDFLAGRLMSALVWLGCILLMVAIERRMRLDPKAAGIGRTRP